MKTLAEPIWNGTWKEELGAQAGDGSDRMAHPKGSTDVSRVGREKSME